MLDILQERASVNTLFLAVFTYGRRIAGRQNSGYRLPNHGKQIYDLNYCANFATGLLVSRQLSLAESEFSRLGRLLLPFAPYYPIKAFVEFIRQQAEHF